MCLRLGVEAPPGPRYRGSLQSSQTPYGSAGWIGKKEGKGMEKKEGKKGKGGREAPSPPLFTSTKIKINNDV